MGCNAAAITIVTVAFLISRYDSLKAPDQPYPIQVSALGFVVLYRSVSPCSAPSGSNPVAILSPLAA